jgi:hypothetical protein
VLHHKRLALTHRASAGAVSGLSWRGSSSVNLEESKEVGNVKKDGSILVPPAKVTSESGNHFATELSATQLTTVAAQPKVSISA